MQTSTTETHNYALRVNEIFDYPNPEPTHVLDACPSSSELVTVNSAFSTGDTFTFQHRFDRSLYMSNALKFRLDIPIEVTLTNNAQESGVDTNITEDNFMATVFNNCQDICLSQYGLLQALQNCQVSLNGRNLTIPTCIPEAINILSQYYNSEDVAEWFPASQPDMFQSFEQYSGNSKILKFIDEDGEHAQTCISPEQDNNIFSCKYTRGYRSRTPVFKWVDQGTDKKRQCRVRCVFDCYLPLSFGSVPNKITSLIGVEDLRVTLGLKPGLLGYLFNTKGTILPAIQSMEVDKTSKSQISGKMMFHLWATPNGTVIPVGQDGNLPSYAIGFPDINVSTGNSETAVPAGAERSFNMSDVQSNSIPKAIYLAIVRVKAGDFKTLTQTPINYGLIKNLECSINGVKTLFNSVSALSYVADTNGYDAFTDPLGRLTKGFAIKLDLTKDLSVPGITAVGIGQPFRISFRGNYVNPGATPADFQPYVLTSLDSSIEFKDGHFAPTAGVSLDVQKLLQSDFIRQMQYNYGRRVDVIGAGLWSSLKKGAVNLAKSAWANRDGIVNTIGDAMSTYRTLRGGERNYSNTTGAGSTQLLGAGGVSTTNFWAQGAGANRTPDFFKRK